MVQLRAGWLPLELETARYWSSRVPVSERVCKLCALDEVETEFHFVIQCPRLSEPMQILGNSGSRHISKLFTVKFFTVL